jgi:P22 tail accessory factor
MAVTKQKIIERALESIGIASYIYDLSYEELNSCLRRLDDLMAEFMTDGYVMGAYPLHIDADDSSLDEEAPINMSYKKVIYLELGRDLAPMFGKNLSKEYEMDVWKSRMTLNNGATFPMTANLNIRYVPAGAGNSNSFGGNYFGRSTFLNAYPRFLLIGHSNILDFY